MAFVEEISEKFKIDGLTGMRLSLINNSYLCVEGHKGLLEISKEIIRIRLKKGMILISGEELEIVGISDSEIYIRGLIKGVEL